MRTRESILHPRATFLLCALLAAAGAAGLARADVPDAAARRLALLHAGADDARAVSRLAAALRDPDPLVARTAARLLVQSGARGRVVLTRAARHPDRLVRRTAVLSLGDVGGSAMRPLERALQDTEPLVRQAAVIALSRLRPATPRALELLAEAGRSDDPGVREAVLAAMRGLFVEAESVRLPRDGWKFRRDPDDVGRDQAWFAPDLDDAEWDDIGIEQAWQHFGHDYVGAGWYRITIDLPARPDVERAEIAFDGVDEMAWVWVNGKYAGSHNIGPMGWDKPFRLDITGLARWGEPNQLTVRAENTAFAGGIWQPVRIVALEWAR